MAATVQTKPAPSTDRPKPVQHQTQAPRANPASPTAKRAIVRPPPAPSRRLAPPPGQKPKRPRHLWSQKEKDFVRLYYRGTRDSRRYLAAVLKVSEHAVAGQVNRMGLCKRSSRAKWTPDEDEQLRTLIGRYPVSRISKIMHRSPNAISVRAKRLKPSRRDRDDWYTLTEVAEILGVDRHWGRAPHHGRHPESIPPARQPESLKAARLPNPQERTQELHTQVPPGTQLVQHRPHHLRRPAVRTPARMMQAATQHNIQTA